MKTLDDLLQDRPSLTLDELASIANELLAQLVQDDPADARVKTEVNARLIRHYVGEKMIDAAVRSGRNVVYGVDQLLQLLALRRLLAGGMPTAAIGSKLVQLDRERLKAIAEGRASLDDVTKQPMQRFSGHDATLPSVARSKSAASILAAIRQRSGLEPSTSEPWDQGPAKSGSASTDVATWERVTLQDGIELHVRDDVRLPQGSLSQRMLLDRIVQAIVIYAQSKRS